MSCVSRIIRDMTVSNLCPLCTASLGQPKSIKVCGHCYLGLKVNPPVVLATTGEFPAIADPTHSPPTPLKHTPNPDAPIEASCCWCDKTSDAVKKLLSQGNYHICNECVALCSDILRMELGDEY